MSFQADVEVVILDSTALIRLYRYDLETALAMAGRALRGHTSQYRTEVVDQARTILAKPDAARRLI